VLSGQTGGRALDAALADPRTQRALAHLDSSSGATAQLLASLGAIVSPSGHERDRATAVAARMRAIGLTDVTVDSTNSAIGRIRGTSGKGVLFVSTLDDLASIAELQRAAGHPPVVSADRVTGPGTNTSLTTAAMLAAAEALAASGVRPYHDLVFAAVAQEETGLVGMKRLYERWKPRAVGVVDILGDGHSITYGAITIHWWRVMARGPAGHTLGGGLPNVNQGIARAVDRVLQLPQGMQITADGQVTRGNDVTINVGTIQSGEVFNHKPDSGWFSLDIRSLDERPVMRTEDSVRAILRRVAKETQISLELQPVQMTPGAQIANAERSPIVITAVAVSTHLGFTPRLNNAGSSNMNVAIAGGTPTIGIAGPRGGRRGYPDEYADRAAMMSTARHVLLLAATLGGASSSAGATPTER